MQIKSDRIVFPDNTEQFTAGGGSGGGSTLESLGIPNHDRLSILGDGVTNTQVSFDNDAVTTSVSCGAVNDRFVIKNGHAERVAVATDGRVDITGSLYVNGTAVGGAGAKAWVNFNGTGTVAIRTSNNVSSITDNGTGEYTMNFTTALTDDNCCALVSGGTNSLTKQVVSTSATSCRIRYFNGSINPVDESHCFTSIFR